MWKNDAYYDWSFNKAQHIKKGNRLFLAVIDLEVYAFLGAYYVKN